MSATTFFRHDVRVSPCDTCGAPLTVRYLGTDFLIEPALR